MDERIKELAKQARLPACHASHPVALKRFAELVRQDEREACAKLCEEYFTPNLGKEIAAAIRARENT
jgi:hypothetical protein